MDYPVIDAHHHFWKYDPLKDAWITEDMKILKKDFLPADLQPVFQNHHISGSVLVQASASESENQFLLELAEKHLFILGLVGWIDLQSDRLEEQLDRYRQFPAIKGFRYLLQGEKKRDLMLDPSFQRGISLLNQSGFSFDLLILPDQLIYAEILVRNFPDQRFVIDHMAKPFIKSGEINPWKLAMQKFAPLQNVSCKISGMVTEASWTHWKNADFRPYMDAVLEIFGPGRVMFGSDWPACLPAANYQQVKQIADEYFRSFTLTEQEAFFSGNAINFYRLN